MRRLSHKLFNMRCLRRSPCRKTLRQDESGATALEFALVAPFALVMIMGTVEVSLVMLAQNIMESATFMASRAGKTGYAAAGQTREQTIMSVLNTRAGTFLDTSRVTITTQTYNQFSQVGEPEPFVDANGNGQRDQGENYTDVNANGQHDADQGRNGIGAAGQVVVYNISYPWRIVTPIVAEVMGTNGVFNLTARSVIKNEPFSSNP